MRRCVQTLDRTCTLGKCTDMKQGDLNLKGSKISTGFALQPTMTQSNWFQCLSAGGSWQSETGEKPGWQLCLREDCSVTPLARQRHGLNKRNSCVSVWSRVLIAAWQPLPHVHVVFKCHMHGAYPSCCCQPAVGQRDSETQAEAVSQGGWRQKLGIFTQSD